MNDLYSDSIATPIGRVRLTFGNDGLHAVEIVNGRGREAGKAAAPQKKAFPGRNAFDRYFDGELDALDALPIVMRGTDFQRRVWSALRTIPAGQTLSYAQLAKRIGNSQASRAVGSANGRNPLCIVVPCHRVIAADGTLGGFSAGLDTKRWLLRHEGAHVKA